MVTTHSNDLYVVVVVGIVMIMACINRSEIAFRCFPKAYLLTITQLSQNCLGSTTHIRVQFVRDQREELQVKKEDEAVSLNSL